MDDIRVLLDGRAIGEEPTGVGSYTLHLARELPRVGVGVVLFGPEESRLMRLGHDVRPGAGLEVVAEARGPLSLGAHRRLRALARERGCVLCHSPYLPFPFSWGGLPLVVTVHDLIPLLDRAWVGRSAKGRFAPLFRAYQAQIVRAAARVITVSGHSAGDLARLFPAAAAKTDVVHNGVRIHSALADADVARELRGLGVVPPYFLYVGRRDPYKKVDLLLEAFAQVRTELPGVALVLVCPPDPRYPEVSARIRRADLADCVRDLGYVHADGLRALYQGAGLLVHPSIYEGFGLPLLEAMAQGTPVLACAAASIPEVVGDAARLVAPNDAAAFAGAMVELWNSPAERAELVRRGRERVREFSWERCALGTREVYARVRDLGGRP